MPTTMMARGTKLRSACDTCYQLKVRCSGNEPCNGCLNSGSLCQYSPSHRLGRPKGTKNKRTTENWAKNAANQTGCNVSRATGNKARSDSQQQPGLSVEQFLPSTMTQGQNSIHASTLSPIPIDKSYGDNNRTIDPMMIEDTSFSPHDTRLSVSWDTSPFGGAHGFGTVGQYSRMGNLGGIVSKDYFNAGDGILDDLLCLSPITTPIRLPTPKSDNSSELNHMDVNRNISEEFTNRNSHQVTPTASPAPLSTPCSCLQQHAELICIPRDSGDPTQIQISGSMMPIDAVLKRAQESLKCWRAFTECRNCAYNEDHEVVMLAFISIRTVLRYLQDIIPEYCQTSPNGDTTMSGTPSQQQKPNLQPSFVNLEEKRLSIGTFNITGEDRTLVIRLLLLNMVREISVILATLDTILDRKKKKVLEGGNSASSMPNTTNKDVARMLADQCQASGSLFYAQQMLQGLKNSAEDLKTLLRKSR